MNGAAESSVFEVRAGFDAGLVGGGLDLGPYSDQYRELFANVIDDGVITAEERQHLDQVARSLGLDVGKLRELERAMMAAYEAHHRVAVDERWQVGAELEAPIASGASSANEPVAALRAEVERLRGRVSELEHELREARAHVNVEVDLSAVEEVVSDDPLDRLRAKIRRDPTNPRLFATFYQASERSGDIDAAARAARALALLGAASPEHQRWLSER